MRQTILMPIARAYFFMRRCMSSEWAEAASVMLWTPLSPENG
jgi:hypothetical protein